MNTPGIKTVWKVVAKHKVKKTMHSYRMVIGDKVRRWGGRVRTPVALQYELNKKTVPEFGYIMAFNSLQDAKDFMGDFLSSTYMAGFIPTILECKAVTVRGGYPIIKYSSTRAEMKAWWKKMFNNRYFM